MFIDEEETKPIPTILLGNKCDLVHEEMHQDEIEEFCKKNGFIDHLEVSAKTGKNIELALQSLTDVVIKDYKEWIDQQEVHPNEDRIVLPGNDGYDSNNKIEKKGCCGSS